MDSRSFAVTAATLLGLGGYVGRDYIGPSGPPVSATQPTITYQSYGARGTVSLPYVTADGKRGRLSVKTDCSTNEQWIRNMSTGKLITEQPAKGECTPAGKPDYEALVKKNVPALLSTLAS